MVALLSLVGLNQMEAPSPQLLLRLIDGWVENENLQNPEFAVADKSIPRDRVNLVLRAIDEARCMHYRGYRDPSPLKIAACVAYAIAQQQPLILLPRADDDFSVKSRQTALLNSSLGLDLGLYIVSNSTYNSEPSILPPFGLKWPSKHFLFETKKSLACDQLSVPALSYIYELILLASDTGRILAKSLDPIAE